MLNKILTCCLISLLAFTTKVLAQDEFCEAVTVILRDAPSQFRNIKTNLIQTSAGAETYRCGIAVPGTMSSRFVFAMGKFYEGALAQSRSLDAIKAPYEKYKKMLERCLKTQGLQMREYDNFNPGLAAYKKVAYMPPFSKNTDLKTLKGHVALEVDYSKHTGLYTLIFYVYEH